MDGHAQNNSRSLIIHFLQKLFLLIFLSVSISIGCLGQKLTISDIKDPFTNNRTLAIRSVKITQLIEASSIIRMNDSNTTYSLTFMMPNSFKWGNDLDTTQQNKCLIKCLDGKIIVGKWESETPFNSNSNVPGVIIYSFSEDDFKYLSITNITDIKFGKIFFNIESKRQDKLKELCTKTLSKM